MVKTRRGIISAATALIMILLLVIPTGTVFAADNVSAHASTTTATMTVTDSGGATIAPDGSGDYKDVPKDAKVRIQYRFALLDDNGLDPADPGFAEYNYSAGDYIDVQLPYAVEFEAPSGGWNVMSNDSIPEVMGTLSIDGNGLARITFTDYVETHSSIVGWFNLEGSFKDSVIDAGDPVKVVVEFAGEIINIEFKSEPVNISSQKNGVYDPVTNEITWTFKVTASRALGSVTLVDSYSKNQTYVPESFMMGGIPVDDADLTIDTSGTNATITYITGLPLGESTFTYKTTPTAAAFAAETGTAENVTFTNRITVYFDGDNKAQSDANVSINWVQKSGAVAGTSLTDSRIINWTVNANASGYNIHDVVITDTIPANLELIEADATHPIRLGGVTLTADATHDPNTYTYEAGSGGTHILTVYAGDLAASRSLTFSTRVTDESIYTKNGTTGITNSVQLGWMEQASGTPTDTGTVNVGQGVLSKSAGSQVNYNDSTTNVINWTVVVNRNSVPITGAVFTDVIPAGLEYVADSFSINDPHDTIPGEFKGTFTYNSGTRTLSYDFGAVREINSMYTITFRTTITNYVPLYVNGTSSYTNSATLTGSGITGGTVTATGTQRYNSQMLAKSVAVVYNHLTKRVTWQIVVDRNQVPMLGAVLTDTIPAGMTFLPETFDVLGVTGETLTSSVVNPVDDLTSHDSFTYTFEDPYSSACTIQFQTQVKEGILLTQGAKSFTNSARLTGTNLDVTATATAGATNNMVTKSLTHLTGADYVTWAIDINREAVMLEDIEASDILQSGLEVDLDSVVLYPLTLDASGSLTKGSTPVSKSLYSVTYDTSTRDLKFTMPGVHSQPYRLEFVTDVVTSPLTVNNTVTMKGESYTVTDKVINVVIQVSESGLGGSGVQGSITIEKTDEHDEPLSGAVYTLYNNKGVEVAHDTTDVDGRIVFGSLPIRTYSIVETAAPTGYTINSTPVRVRMGTDTPDVFYKFEDNLIRGSIRITKTNVDSEPLIGAVYGLYSADDTDFSDPVASSTSLLDGSMLFENIAYGNYFIREISAPVGYTVSSQTVPVSITEDGVLVTASPAAVQDERIKGSIRMLKLAAGGKAPLGGALFGLYLPSDTSFLSPVAQDMSETDGEVLFENINYGDYIIREISAPAGYAVSRATVSVQIRNDGETVDAGTFTDRKRPPEDSPDTGDGILLFAGIFAACAIGLSAIVIISRRKAKQ